MHKPFQCFFVKILNTIFSLLGLKPNLKSLCKSKINNVQFKKNLENLIVDIERSSNLTSFGYIYIGGLIKSFVKNHSSLQKYVKKFPQIFDEKIDSPLVILGLPRSGTTFLFNLLSCDNQFQYLTNWEVTVSPVPKGFSKVLDLRRSIGKILIKMQNKLAPQLNKIHEFALDGPEECTPILMHTFLTQALDPMFNKSQLSARLNNENFVEVYKFHKVYLQTLQFQRSKRSWILKSPDHLAGVQALLAVYPDAKLVHLYRDPSYSVASWASLNLTFQGIWMSELNHNKLGQQVLDRLSFDMNRFIEYRQYNPSTPFCDISYDELIKSPLDVVKKIYTFFNLELATEVEAEMIAFLQKKGSSKSSHKYSLEMFGLDNVMVSEKFSRYLDAFKIRVK